MIVAGVLFLLQSLGVIQFADIIWGILLGLAGVFILSFYFADRKNWWAFIPGIILLVLAVVIVLATFFPGFGGTMIGALFLGGIGMSFFIIYLVRRDFWWEIIPAGALFTLAAVVVVSALGYELASGGVFFFGLGLTFALLAFVRTPGGRLTWAWIPALVLIVLGLLALGAATNLINYLWPVIVN